MKVLRVGYVQILKPRIYPLDPYAPSGTTEVVVQPGMYPIYEDGQRRWFHMTGRINEGPLMRLGDGVFIASLGSTPGDRGSGPMVTVMSRYYGPSEWIELMAMPICQDGPDQRLMLHMIPFGEQPEEDV